MKKYLGVRKIGWLTWEASVQVGNVIYSWNAYTKRGASKSAMAFFIARPELEEEEDTEDGFQPYVHRDGGSLAGE